MQKLQVKIQTVDEVLWAGKAEWVSSLNSRGAFDILPMHANFITIVKDQPVRVNTDGVVKEFKFRNCVIYVYKNQVTVYGDV